MLFKASIIVAMWQDKIEVNSMRNISKLDFCLQFICSKRCFKLVSGHLKII